MAQKILNQQNLKIKNGVNQPSSVNNEAISKQKSKKKKRYSSDEYFQGIKQGNRVILSQAITIIESSHSEHISLAQEIIEKCLPYSGNSLRIGITGIPGVGKSSFIESMGNFITSRNHKIAVLAIDPSSEQSKGSILGDKTRMETLSVNRNAFIRPSPSAGTLGGVARKTRETIILCEAAGFDIILVETVGVGQSETAVHSMVDFFLLLMLAGAGDELQGIKRGIIEMANAIVITKADGSNIEKAEQAKSQYSSALHLYPPSGSGWTPTVLKCSAHKNTGISKIWETIMDYKNLTKNNGYFELNRRTQARFWMHETISQSLKDNFYQHPKIKSLLKKIEDQVLNDKKSSFIAAKDLLNEFFKK